MAKHTEGPWHVNANGPTPIIYDASGYAIADATTFHGKHREGEAVANAQLMAAAPDLLSMVVEYRRVVDWSIKHDAGDSEGKALKKMNLMFIDQVIAKAKGEA